jgi:DNA-binding transcriptional regulator YhcF (GntR family)/DNA-binding LacI/PurR family transcriptional regulator
MTTATPLTENLKSWIDEQLRTRKPGWCFPPDREISSKFGVCTKTVARVFKEYRKKDLVWRIRGKGTIIPDKGEKEKPEIEDRPASSAEAVADAIYKSICTGEIRRGMPLPSVKFLYKQFKIGSRTAIEAYRILQRRGCITRIGQRFWVGTLTDSIVQKAGKEVFLFQHKSDDFSTVFSYDLLAKAYRRMEEELGVHGFALRYESTDSLRELVSQWATNKRPAYGCVFYNMGSDSIADSVPHLESLVKKLKTDTPPILVDWKYGDARVLPRRVRILSRGNILTLATRAIASYLIENGYKEAAFFLDDTRERQAWIFADVLRLRSELKHLKSDFNFRVAVKPMPQHRNKSIFMEQRKTEPAVRILQKYHPYLFEVLDDEIELHADLAKAFTGYRSIPIWIFSRATLAVAALEWAGKKNIRVPQDISIMTVEDDPATYHYGISYCGPDWARIGYLMAHIIIGDFPIKRSSKGFMVTGARIVEKLTTK